MFITKKKRDVNTVKKKDWWFILSYKAKGEREREGSEDKVGLKESLVRE